MSAEDMNIVICGHVDHGKSTLLGRLVHELGQVDRAAWAKAEAFIRDYGKTTTANVYSALVARQTTEREQGRTFVPSHVRVRLGDRDLTIVDTPGSIEFKRGRVYGTFLADVGVLVVAANRGPEAQTREALLLLRGLGVPLGGVVISKMDLADAPERANDIQRTVQALIDESEVPTPACGVRWVAVSALRGPSLEPVVELLRGLEAVRRAADGPLRFCVQGRQELFQVSGLGAVALGVVESGRLSVGDELAIEPASAEAGRLITARVRSLRLARGRNEPDGADVREARPRDIVSVGLGRSWEDVVQLLSGGGVLSHTNSRPAVVSRLEAEITVLKKTTGAHIGWTPYLLAHVMGAPCQLVDIQSVRTTYKDWTDDWRTDKSLVKECEEAKVVLQLERPLPLELREGLAKMARFSLREHHNVSALGVCTSFPMLLRPGAPQP